MVITVTTYRLRGGNVQPQIATCAGGIPTFYAQTFGAEKIQIDVFDAKTELLTSADMQGQKFGDLEDPAYRASTYSRASYQGRPLRTTDGDLVYSATEEHVAEWTEEEELGVV